MELELVVTADEYADLVAGNTRWIFKRFSRRWQKILEEEGGDFDKYSTALVKAHGVGEFKGDIVWMGRRSVGEGANRAPCYCIQVLTPTPYKYVVIKRTNVRAYRKRDRLVKQEV